MSVLVTAFGPFDGGSNASQAMLEELGRRQDRLEGLAGVPVALLLLPVDTHAAPQLLAERIDALRPSYLLLTGQAAGRSRVTLERIAVNLRDFHVPDHRGRLVRGEPIAADGPEAYRATWPDLPGAVAAIERAGIPAAVSHHAGTHLCNQTLYFALHRAATRGFGPRSTFLHLPVTPAQVIAREPAAERAPNCPYLEPSRAADAVEILLGRLGLGDDPCAARTDAEVLVA